MKNHLLTWRLRTLSLREDERVAHGHPVCPPRNEHTARTQAVPLDRAPFAFRSSSFLARALQCSPLWAPLHPPPGGLLWGSYQPQGPDSQGARQGVWVRGGRPATQVALAQPRASLSPRSTWRSCPSWRTTPSRCRAATRRWSRCGSTVCSSVSTCPARPCSSSEPRSICVRWARGSCPQRTAHLPSRVPVSWESAPTLPGPPCEPPCGRSQPRCALSHLFGTPAPLFIGLTWSHLSGLSLETPSSGKPSLLPKPFLPGPGTYLLFS